MPFTPPPQHPGAHAEVGVLGGSGFYAFGTGERVAVRTPFGDPSEAPVVTGVDGTAVAFVPRHGADHRFPPHRVPYRANLWALRALGVRHVLAPCAVGSLVAEVAPGDVVLPDQLLDRTWGREHTFHDGVDGVEHVSFADPYSATGQAAAAAVAAELGLRVHPRGTLVVVNGPRFSTRAESRSHAAQGGTVIGMTGMPEAALARELGMEYTAIAMVTDRDAGTVEGAGVTQQEVLAVMRANTAVLEHLLRALVPRLAGS